MILVFCKDMGCCNEIITAENGLKLRNLYFNHLRENHLDLFKSMSQEMKRDLNEKSNLDFFKSNRIKLGLF